MAGILNGNNSVVIYMQLTAFLWKLEDRKQSIDSNNAAFTKKKKKKIPQIPKKEEQIRYWVM